MLEHLIFQSPQEENEYWRTHPSSHLVKAVVIGREIHVWITPNYIPFNGGHMKRGGVDGDGTTYDKVDGFQ